jgi:signal transduction histidine kinase
MAREDISKPISESEARYKQELDRARCLIRQRTAELEAVLAATPLAIYVMPAKGPLRVNQNARALSGEDFPSELHTLENALEGKSSTETVRTSNHWIRSAGMPIVLDGEIFGAIAVNTDLTQQRLQHEALRKSEKLAAVGQLTSAIAHEINNPLESITNLLYLVRHADNLEDVQAYAALAQEELGRVSEITMQTLRFHRQRSKPAEVDLAELLRAILVLYTGRLLVRGMTVETRLLPTPPAFCLEGEIRQVVNNLIRNALDAMNGARGRLLIRLHPQQDWRTMREGVRITVADTGEGIRPEISNHLFEPFQTTKEVTGTGLGLWVSKEIVERHGGFICVRTRRGKGHGTVFSVWLPERGDVNQSEAD